MDIKGTSLHFDDNIAFLKMMSTLEDFEYLFSCINNHLKEVGGRVKVKLVELNVHGHYAS